ncbi:MAG: zinc-ribbon domain-containing protein [Lachnospiraceae bacterium]|nr:zinc-ribbon domain-containing protein [Lachnospiraceae bacterium]
MKCSSCGYNYGDDARFCPNCGVVNNPGQQMNDQQQGY